MESITARYRREVLESVTRLVAKGETVRLDDIFTDLPGDMTDLPKIDQALQYHRRRGALKYVTKRGKKGATRQRWGWLVCCD